LHCCEIRETSAFRALSGLPTFALRAGAHGITVHPRPDARHIRASDVHDLSQLLKQWPDAEFNIEGNPFEPPLLELADAVRPQQCTLVPDDPAAFTSDHGWDLARHGDRLRPVIAGLQDLGVRVSLFMDPAAGSDDYCRSCRRRSCRTLYRALCGCIWHRRGGRNRCPLC